MTPNDIVIDFGGLRLTFGDLQALMADKRRLDWLDGASYEGIDRFELLFNRWVPPEDRSARQAIDRAREQAR